MNHLGERLRLALWDRLPIRWRNQLTAFHMGQLTVLDPRLHSREVPVITAQEFLNAMKASEGRG